MQAAIHRAEETGEWADVITSYIGAAHAGSPGEAFYLTHAYIHALEANDPRAPDLKTRLIALGAERR